MKVVLILVSLNLCCSLFASQTFTIVSTPLEQDLDIRWTSVHANSEVKLNLRYTDTLAFSYNVIAYREYFTFKVGTKAPSTYISILPNQLWHERNIKHSSFMVSHLIGNNKEQLLYVGFDRLFLAYLSIPAREKKSVYANYQKDLEGKLFCFGWDANFNDVHLRLQAVYGQSHALSLTTKLSYRRDSFSISSEWGDAQWPLQTSYQLEMEQSHLQISYRVSTALGRDAVFGGSYQAFKSSHKARMLYSFGTWNVKGEHQTGVYFNERGIKKDEQKATVALMFNKVSLGYCYTEPDDHSFFLEQEKMRLSVSDKYVLLSFQLKMEGFQLMLRYTKQKGLSLHFQLTFPICPDNEFPLQE